jgi:hypothetical protein
MASELSTAHGTDPRPPARATSLAIAAPLDPAIGAWTIGTSIPKVSVNLVFIASVLLVRSRGCTSPDRQRRGDDAAVAVYGTSRMSPAGQW